MAQATRAAKPIPRLSTTSAARVMSSLCTEQIAGQQLPAPGECPKVRGVAATVRPQQVGEPVRYSSARGPSQTDNAGVDALRSGHEIGAVDAGFVGVP